MVAKQTIRFLIVCYYKKTCEKHSFSKKEGRKQNLKPKQPKFEYYFCHVRLPNQPHFLLLPSSASVCSDASFLVSS